MIKHTKVENSLSVLLAATAIIVIFPVLGRVEPQPDEILIANLARQFSSSGISSVFDGHGSDFPINFYSYLVSLTMNLWNLPDTYSVRLPSAIIITLLTTGMFLFRGQDEKPGKAFLASLLFLSSYTISSLAYHANVISLMALFFIFSLSSIYHWIKQPSAEKAWWLIAATSCATIFMGILAPAIALAVGGIFILLQNDKRKIMLSKMLLMTAASTVIAYLAVTFITNDRQSADNVLGITQITSKFEEYGKLTSFAGHAFFSIFPWSIPIIVALFWIASHPAWLRNKFLALSLLKQFGVILFIIAIPTMIALNRLSLIMLLASIYFNMPIISSFLLSQIHNHSVTWRITGGIFAALTALLAIIFMAIASGAEISIAGYSIADFHGWTIWKILLIMAIAVSLYTLWRNQRTIRFNNRYLYNIVILYLLAQILYKAFINPYIATA